MQVSVEKISNIERRLTIVVPAEQVKAAIDKQVNHIAKTAKLEGFRPGKAPVSYVQQRYGNEARKEALEEVMKNALYQAIAEQKLRPVNMPQIEPKAMLADQPFEFVALFEVLPEIENVQCSLPSIEKAIVEVKEEDVDRVISQLKKQYTKWAAVDRAAKEKDRVIIDYYAIFEGKSDIDNKIEGYPLELGSKVMLPGFEEGLIGAKANDERTLHLAFPDDLKIQDKAGKPVEFVVTIKQVLEANVPSLDVEMVQRLGIKSGEEAELKTQIKQSLEQERDRLVQEKLKEQVFSQLLNQNPIDVPKSLIAHEAKNIHDEVYQHQHHDHHQHTTEEFAVFDEMAKKRVALGLLIGAYAKQIGLTVDKERVQQRIQEIAAAYEKPEEVINWLSSSERKSGIEAQVMEDQVMDKLMEGTTITEKPMSYAELKGIHL